jgi:dephospho-CoA kinase
MLQDILRRKRSSIIIVGHSGSGKTTLASILALRSGIQIIEVGHQVIREALDIGITPLEFADAKIREGKQLHFVEQVLADWEPEHPIIVVGPRLPQEVEFLKSALGPTIVIGLEAPDEIREIRRCEPSELRKGKRSWLHHRDMVERSWGADNALNMASVILDATRTPSELVVQVDSIWEEYGIPLLRRSISYSFMQRLNCIMKSRESALEALDESSLIKVTR